MPQVFVKRSRIPAPVERVFRWHERPDAFEKVAPPWEASSVKAGLRLETTTGPMRVGWVGGPFEYRRDRQAGNERGKGSLSYWKHTRLFEPDGPAACILEDRIEYRLPLGWLGQWFGGWWIRWKLERMFAHRHQVTLRETARPSEN